MKAIALFLLLGITAGSSVFAQITGHPLVFTEKSSTELLVTYDGSTAGISVQLTTPGVPDDWSVIFPNYVTFDVGTQNWLEPENSGLINNVNFSTGENLARIFSDTPSTLGGAPNGTTIVELGTDTRDHDSISVTFNDVGDVPSTVPDTGSTFGLLSLSLIALFGATRFRLA